MVERNLLLNKSNNFKVAIGRASASSATNSSDSRPQLATNAFFDIRGVSKVHGYLYVENNKLYYKDNASRNGTKVTDNQQLTISVYPDDPHFLLDLSSRESLGEDIPVAKFHLSPNLSLPQSLKLQVKLKVVNSRARDDLSVETKGLTLNTPDVETESNTAEARADDFEEIAVDGFVSSAQKERFNFDSDSGAGLKRLKENELMALADGDESEFSGLSSSDEEPESAQIEKGYESFAEFDVTAGLDSSINPEPSDALTNDKYDNSTKSSDAVTQIISFRKDGDILDLVFEEKKEENDDEYDEEGQDYEEFEEFEEYDEDEEEKEEEEKDEGEDADEDDDEDEENDENDEDEEGGEEQEVYIHKIVFNEETKESDDKGTEKNEAKEGGEEPNEIEKDTPLQSGSSAIHVEADAPGAVSLNEPTPAILKRKREDDDIATPDNTTPTPSTEFATNAFSVSSLESKTSSDIPQAQPVESDKPPTKRHRTALTQFKAFALGAAAGSVMTIAALLASAPDSQKS